MPIKIRIWRRYEPVGEIEFRCALAGQLDYSVTPQHLLGDREVQILANQLRRLPAVHEGSFGEYHWFEAREDGEP